MAYGPTPGPDRPSGSLRPRSYAIPKDPKRSIIALPFECEKGGKDVVPGALREVLAGLFNEELEKGLTYPQKGPLPAAEFEGYFMGYDLIVGILSDPARADASLTGTTIKEDVVGPLADLSAEEWSKKLAFAYYIKPNYPSRSSHLCNAGFLVPPSVRGLGMGSVAGQSFLHYGPQAGYRGSVFNLVYANNVASLAIWDRLGFTRVGRIPGAGLLKKEGGGEHYVDAWVIHGDFEKIAVRDEGVESAREAEVRLE